MGDTDNAVPAEPVSKSEQELEFTGERVVPGKVDPDLFNEHFARYVYARSFCSGQRVLDTGCGVGYGSAYLAELASQVVGLDNDPKAIQYAGSHYGGHNTVWVVGNCQQLPFSSHSFDLVTSFELIEHLPDADAYLEEVGRVLRDGGAFLVSTPNRPVYHEHLGQFRNPFHVREWDHDEFVALLQKYFAAVEVLGESHFSAVGIVAPDATAPVSAVIDAQPSVRSADYFVCVCSARQHKHSSLLLVPPSANVLLERERHVRSLESQLKERETYLARLQPEFEAMAAWATKLNAELAATQAECARLQGEVGELRLLWSKATRWKRGLVCFALAPLDWAVGGLLLATEMAARLWRRLSLHRAPSAAVSDPTRASIVIVSWQGKELLADSLPPLVRAVGSHGGNHEIIVVDNGSTDGTQEYIATNFPQVRVVRSEQNLFFGGGNNLGARHAKNEILVLLNNDMIVGDNFLAPLLEPFRETDVFAVASQVFLADPRKLREETGKTRATFDGCDFEWRHEAISAADEQQKYVPVFWGHGGAVAIDRQKFLSLGGFDGLFDPFYVEDADLSYQAWKAGWRCLLAVDSKVVHKHRSSTSRFGKAFITQIVRRNQELFFWKNVGDLAMLVAHFGRAARWRVKRAGIPGVGIRLECRAWLGAAKRLPGVIRRRFRLASQRVRNDQQVLSLANASSAPFTSSSEMDFSRGAAEEQLGKGWYPAENHGGRAYRWMGKTACVYLLAPSESALLSVRGYLPPLERYKARSRNLTVCCGGQRRQFAIAEGVFEQDYCVTGLKAGASVEVGLEIDHVIEPTDADSRTLGLIVNRIALTPSAPAQNSDGGRVSISRSSEPAEAAAATHSQEVSGQRRVLMLCAYLPCLGVHSGGNTMFNLIRALSRRHRLTVLSFYEREKEKEEFVPLLAPYCERLEVIYRGQTFETPNLFGLKPPEIVHEFYHRRMEKLVREYLLSSRFDLMQCEYLQMGHLAYVSPDIPAVLTNHEVVSLSCSNRFHALPWTSRAKLQALVSWTRMLNYEEKLIRRFSAVVVLTQPEREFLARYAPGVKVYDHATGVDCEFFSPGSEVPEKGSVIFVGNFRHAPNVSAMTWFLEQVWPKIRSAYPGARLSVVGGNPPPSLQAAHGREGIAVTGWVEDVRPYLQQSAVFVAPVLEGVGLRGKVLEAWAMQKPVVGTRLSFEALGAKDGATCFIADDAETFAARTCELLRDDELAARMGEQARRLAANCFSWEAFAELYDRIYQEILRSQDGTALGMKSAVLQTV